MIDIESLLLPVSEATPYGEDLSFAGELDTIQEFRRSDDPSLDQGAWVTDLKSADWNAVSRLCETLLKDRSKDLRIASWMAEAQAHLHGFAGLAAGYRLMTELCARYWDGLYPDPAGEDIELRLGNIEWLLKQSVQWARGIPLMESGHGRYSLIDIEVARSRAGHPAGESSGPTVEQVEQARGNTSFEFYRRMAEEAPTALQELNLLEKTVDMRFGVHGPSFSAARSALTDVVDTLLRYAREAGVRIDGDDASADIEVPAAIEQAVKTQTVTSAPVAAASPGEITSRKEAIAQLRRVAEFFRRTEPHSPVAYLADKAARWSSMPLHVWLKSVVKDSSSLAQLEEMLDVGTDESRGET